MSRPMVTAGAALFAVTLVAACGSSSSGSGGGSGGGGSASSAGKAVNGGNLIIARTADSQSMNNTNVFDNESIWIFENIFDTLYTVTPNGKSVQPDLATGYKVSNAKKTYTFTLRPGVKFSTGQPLTSADVKFSIDKARAAAQGWGYIDTAIKNVQAPSPNTVVVNLKYPWAPLLADLSLFSNGIVPDNYGGKTETAFYQAPVGTGPFKWGFWHKGQALKLVKNTNYWKPGLPHLDSVTWTDTPSDNTRELQLKGGQAQVDEFPAWSTVSSLKSTPGITMNLFPSTRTDYVLFNEKRAPFNDVHVRRAMSLAIDRQALVKAVLFGNGKPANSVFPPQVPYYQAATQGLQLNVSQAKAEMAKSSQPHGFSTTFLIPSGESDDSTIAQIIQSDVAPLGIKIKIQQLDQNTVNTDQQGLNYDMSLSYWTMDIPDPDELATFAVDPKSGAKSFYTDYDNPAVVSAVHAAEKTLSTTGRQALYNKVQTQSAADAFMAFLYYSPYAYAASSKLHGFYVTPLGNYHLENAWLSK
ncbi:MAG TPA: ABC transporter substrate-binding protein [Mycobacteriales bacterium]|nr:ABC transporter substrate-binding protein [Mycobacteriales bacterium]